MNNTAELSVDNTAPFPFQLQSHSSSGRINALAQHIGAKLYLEIGVLNGATFFAVTIPIKVAVDPNFLFDPKEHETSGTHFFPMPSDDFFKSLATGAPEAIPLTKGTPGGHPAFDIIFIDGLHTFEQSFRDFENSIAYAHENTLWLLDDTVPSDPYSALPDQQKARIFRKSAGLAGGLWHGDVFKTVLAIHDRYLEFSYCTLMERNPQTVVWRHPRGAGKRTPVFSSLEEIAGLDYFAMLEHAALLMPTRSDTLCDLLGKALDPARHGAPDAWKTLMHRKLVTTSEQLIRKKIKSRRP